MAGKANVRENPAYGKVPPAGRLRLSPPADMREEKMQKGEEKKEIKSKVRGCKGYDYNPEFMRVAWDLYLQGISATQIAERLKKEWPGLCRQSVSRIVNLYDWEKQRVRILELKRDIIADREKILADLWMTYDRIIEIIRGPEPNYQHFSQYSRIVDQIREIEGWDSRAGGTGMVLATDQEMSAYLETLQEDEVLGPMMKRRKLEIKKRFEEKLKERGFGENGE